MPLGLITMLAHEGGHGILIVPALIISGAIPPAPTDLLNQVNGEIPPNVIIILLSMALSFPLGITVNALISYLSYKNAKLCSLCQTNKELTLFIVFVALSIMNFNSILTNLFGADFSFLMEDFLSIPIWEDWFRNILKVVSFFIFPLFLIKKKRFHLLKTLVISLGTFLGSIFSNQFILIFLYPIFMTNFWWLFIIGLFILIPTIITLIVSKKTLSLKINE